MTDNTIAKVWWSISDVCEETGLSHQQVKTAIGYLKIRYSKTIKVKMTKLEAQLLIKTLKWCTIFNVHVSNLEGMSRDKIGLLILLNVVPEGLVHVSLNTSNHVVGYVISYMTKISHIELEKMKIVHTSYCYVFTEKDLDYAQKLINFQRESGMKWKFILKMPIQSMEGIIEVYYNIR